MSVLFETHDVLVPLGQNAAGLVAAAGHGDLHAKAGLAGKTLDSTAAAGMEIGRPPEDLVAHVLKQFELALGPCQTGPNDGGDQVALGAVAPGHDHRRAVLISARIHLEPQRFHRFSQAGGRRCRGIRTADRLGAADCRIHFVRQDLFENVHPTVGTGYR